MWRRTACAFLAYAIAACGGSSTSPAGSGGSGVGGTAAGGAVGSGGAAGSAATGGAGIGGGGTAATGGSGGLAGSGGVAGSPDCTAKCGLAGCPACSGPTMVSNQEPEGAKYRIDTTEVTNAQYTEFLNAAVPVANQPSDCSWNDDYAPDTSEPGCTASLFNLGTRATYPVVCVDWCDARAYCEWAGKRLCLNAGGKPTDGFPSAEWVYACSANDTQTFPYGDSYDTNACNGQDHGVKGLVPVASLPSCEGGLPGLFDMSGNAYEWEGTCNDPGPLANCSASGGSYKWDNINGKLQCIPTIGGQSPARTSHWNDLGFRCCADALP